MLFSRGGHYLCVKTFKSNETLHRFMKYIVPKIYPDPSGVYYEKTNM